MRLSGRQALKWWIPTLVTLVVSPFVWSQEMKPSWTGNELKVSSPSLRFLNGKPLESIRNGRAVAFDFQLLLQSGETPLKRTAERFVISYDLWEEKFSVTRLARDKTQRKQASHLSEEAAQSWCLDNLSVPTEGVSRDRQFQVMLEIRAEDARDPRGFLSEPGISLFALIEIFSRPARAQQLKWNLQHGPVRLNEIRQ